jgi:HEAT repeat protein
MSRSPIRSVAPRCAAATLAALLVTLVTGCGEDRDVIFHAGTPAKADTSQQDITAEIAQLAKGKNPRDVAASAAYDEAVAKLTGRGTSIETRIIDALRTDPDWSVRMGCVEVLQSIGTKASVEHLIAALVDDQPLVSFHANRTLEEMTKHHEIPERGKPVTTNGLPPLPEREAHDLAMSAELRLWTAYHNQYRKQLHDGWAAWWAENKKSVKIE